MLNRSFLVRFTRLGLAMYVLFWCMSFTVCASDHPLADMAVSESISLLQAVDETPLDETITDGDSTTGDTQPDPARLTPAEPEDGDGLLPAAGNETVPENVSYPADDPDEKKDSEDVLPEVSEDTLPEAGEDVMPADTNEVISENNASDLYGGSVSLDIEFNITVNDIVQPGNTFDVTTGDTYALEIYSADPECPTIDPSRIVEWNLYEYDNGYTKINPDETDGITFSNSSEFANISFDGYKSAATFYLNVSYNTGSPEDITLIQANATFNVDMYSHDVTTLSFGDMGGDDVIVLNNVSRLENFTVYGDTENHDVNLNPENMEWGIVPVNSTDFSEMSATWNGVKLITNGSDMSGLGASINCTEATKNSYFDLIAIYKNSESDSVAARAHINVKVFEADVEEIVLDSDSLFICDKSQEYNITVSAGDSDATLNPEKLTFELVDYVTNETTDIYGVSISKQDTTCIINISELYESQVFRINATYVNSLGEVLVASCLVDVHVVVTEIGLDVSSDGNPLPENETIISEFISSYQKNITLRTRALTPEGVSLNYEKLNWIVSHNGRNITLDSSEPIIGDGYNISDNGNGQVNVTINRNIADDTTFIVTARYQDSIESVLGYNMTMPPSYAVYCVKVEMDKVTSDIRFTEPSLTITDFNKTYNIDVICDDEGSTIDPSRLSYSILNENKTPATISGVHLTRLAGDTGCVLDVSGLYKSAKFYINATYFNSTVGYKNCLMPVVATVVSSQLRFDMSASGDAVTSMPNPLIYGNNGSLLFGARSARPNYIELNLDGFSWKIYENGTSLSSDDLAERGIIFETNRNESRIRLSDEFDGYGQFTLMAVYNNTYIDADGQYVHVPDAKGYCNITIDTRPVSADSIEAHFPEQSATVQVYNTYNWIPFVMRYIDPDKGGLRYSAFKFIQSVELVGVTDKDQEIIDYLNTTFSFNNESINVNVDLSKVNSTVLSQIIKKRTVKAYLRVGLDIKDSQFYYNTTETLTISFGTAKPTVKATNILEFDSFKINTESRSVYFTGAAVEHIEFANPSAAAKSGLTIGGARSIRSTTGLPAKTGKKTIKVIAFISDSDYRLLGNYNVTVPVTYIVNNGAPVISLASTSCTLNAYTDDYQDFMFNVSNATSTTMVLPQLLDSKGNPLNTSNLTITRSYYTGASSGFITIRANENTTPGQTYKVALYPMNTNGGAKGAKKIVTIKTVSQKNAEKYSLSVKAKGSVDASMYGSKLTLTLSGKNINLYDRITADEDGSIKIMCNNTDIKEEYFDVYEDGTGMIEITEVTPFSLIRDGYAGQKATVIIDYGELSENRHLNCSYSFKIGKSTVTPKLNATTVSYTPGVDTSDIHIQVNNLINGTYAYDVTATCGKANITADYSLDDSYGYDRFAIDTDMLQSFIGKTVAVKITPTTGNSGIKLPAKAATLNIKVLNATKAKPTVSAKVKGNIDSIRDTTSSVINLSYKNIYNPESIIIASSTSIYQTRKVDKNTTRIDYDDFFNVAFNGGVTSCAISRHPGKDLAPGTYKIDIILLLSEGQELTTTTSFKVVRGKSGTKLALTGGTYSGKLINREYSRYVFYNATYNDYKVNGISGIVLGGNGKFNDTFDLVQPYYSTYSFQLFLKNGYIEKNKNKPITKAVTKTVPIEIYYYGSTVPDKINIKVTINP